MAVLYIGVISYVVLVHFVSVSSVFLVHVLFLGYMDESGQVVGESSDDFVTGEHVYTVAT